MSDLNDKKINKELLNLYYKQQPVLLVTNILVALFVVIVMWEVTPHYRLVVWIVLNCLVVTGSYFHSQWYLRLPQTSPLLGKWHKHLVIIAIVFGTTWGLGFTFLVNEQSPIYLLFFLVVVIGMSTGATSSIIVYKAFTISMMLFTGMHLLLMDDLIFISLGIMSFIYALATLHIVKPLHDSLHQSLELRYENLELVESLKLKIDEVDSANLEKSQFLAAASHDLRQPLHALDLFTGNLGRHVENAKGKEVLNNIRNSLDSLRMLIDSLLDISKLDTGAIEINRRHIELTRVFENLNSEFQSVAELDGRHISFPDNAPVADCDEALLTSVLNNLIQNALSHGEGDITVGCIKFGGKISISVTDQGPGIPESEQERIFSEFYQLDNPERDRGKGLGLGLAISRRIAMILGNELTLQSTPGEGSTFIYSVSAGDPLQVDYSKNIDTSSVRLDDVNILIVEDELVILNAMQQLLEGWHCQCWNAEDLEASLELIDQGVTPDLLISDYRLRGDERGTDVIHEIRNRVKHDLPAILITGDTSQKGLNSVEDEKIRVLHKPVPPDRLNRAIREMLVPAD